MDKPELRELPWPEFKKVISASADAVWKIAMSTMPDEEKNALASREYAALDQRYQLTHSFYSGPQTMLTRETARDLIVGWYLWEAFGAPMNGGTWQIRSGASTIAGNLMRDAEPLFV